MAGMEKQGILVRQALLTAFALAALALAGCNIPADHESSEIGSAGKEVSTMEGKRIGVVEVYYKEPGVAAIILEDELKTGESIRIKGKKTDMSIKVNEINIDYDSVEKASKGDVIGISVPEEVYEGDEVFRN